jgi:hypothetical protein
MRGPRTRKGAGKPAVSALHRSIPLAELIEQQGIAPAEDLGEIEALWPADDNPDELLQYILLERSERRKLTRGEE